MNPFFNIKIPSQMKGCLNSHPLPMSRWAVLVLVSVGFIIQFAIDWGLQNDVLGRRELTVWLDPIAHVVLASTVILPWMVALRLPRSYLLLAAAAAFLIDIDHVVAARSFSLTAAISLPGRPISHSLLFSSGVAMIFGLMVRRTTAAIVVLIALFTHVSRDATGGGTPLLWPLAESTRIPADWHIGFWLMVDLAGSFWRFRKDRAEDRA